MLDDSDNPVRLRPVELDKLETLSEKSFKLLNRLIEMFEHEENIKSLLLKLRKFKLGESTRLMPINPSFSIDHKYN